MYSIILSLDKRQLYVFGDNQMIRTYPVGIGKDATPTPIGSYRIIDKVPNPGGVFGVMWLGLSIPKYGIHGTNNPQSIGKQVSKGCIRMHNKDVLDLARMIPIGTSVTIRK
ncbi:L,D-transpeptidase [Dehalobacter sp. DCM]|uniref:L,D-transpeptidase n=1 Tax=Dehalobacter sp. DCM TaxID=2907827 RepID=UPI0030821418|nr:L,D-transpeptidase [Dehalobacter sp. DCM]